MALKGARRAWQALRAPENFEFDAAIFLCAATIICSLLGWCLRPSLSAPLQLPPAPGLVINFPGPQPPPQSLTVDSELVQTGNSQAELKVNAAGVFRPNQKMITWTLAVEGSFTGSVCEPAHLQPPSVRFPVQNYYNYQIQMTSRVPANGNVFLLVHLCWTDNSPIAISGSYLSANLPYVIAPDQIGTVTRVLQLPGTSLSAYTLNQGIEPATTLTPQAWTWQSPLSTNTGSQASAAISVFGSSIVGVQEASDRTFYSGILFGIAGGAIVSVVLVLPGLFKRMLERRRARRTRSAALRSGRIYPPSLLAR
jgi:hypothetical protein